MGICIVERHYLRRALSSRNLVVEVYDAHILEELVHRIGRVFVDGVLLSNHLPESVEICQVAVVPEAVHKGIEVAFAVFFCEIFKQSCLVRSEA